MKIRFYFRVTKHVDDETYSRRLLKQFRYSGVFSKYVVWRRSKYISWHSFEIDSTYYIPAEILEAPTSGEWTLTVHTHSIRRDVKSTKYIMHFEKEEDLVLLLLLGLRGKSVQW